MSNAARILTEGFNYYVPAMQAAADLGQSLSQRVEFGAPIAASATLILSAQSIAAAVDTVTFALSAALLNTEANMSRFGRNVQVVASGAATSTVTVYGRDYLGQKMRETLTPNCTTP